jgi:hypothetical protein
MWQESWLLHHDSAPSCISLFHQRILLPETTWLLPSIHPPCQTRLPVTSRFPYFQAVEVVQAESQAVLNTLTEHDPQDALKKQKEHWQPYIHSEGDHFGVEFLTRWQHQFQKFWIAVVCYAEYFSNCVLFCILAVRNISYYGLVVIFVCLYICWRYQSIFLRSVMRCEA